MEDTDSHVVGDSEKRIEDMDKLQKRLEELERNEVARAAEAATLQERLDNVERERSRFSRRDALQKVWMELNSKQIASEKKEYEERADVHKEREASLEGENNVLRGEVKDLKGENGILREEVEEVKRALVECVNDKTQMVKKNEEQKIESGILKEEITELRGENNLLKGEMEKLKRRVKEMEDEKIPAMNFTEEDIKLEEQDIKLEEEEDMGMITSLIDHSFNIDTSNLRTISNGDDPTLAGNFSINDLPSGIDEGIVQSQEIDQVERKRRPSRNSSKHVKYNDSLEDFDGDGWPSMKKIKSDCGQMNDKKGKSTLKKDSSESDRKAKMSDTEMECPECEFITRSADSFFDHLRKKHNTNLHLSGLALLCECGHEVFSSGRHSHFYQCNVANFTLIRKRDGPIQRLDDEKVTPQCILCEEYPKTAFGYAEHLKVHHKSTLMKNGIYLLCSCGLKVRTQHDRIHNINCNPRQFSLHKLDQK